MIIYSTVHLIHREKHRERQSVETKMKISYVSFLILFELTGTARALVSTKSSSSGIMSGSSRCSSFITSRHSNRSFHPNNIGKSTTGSILRINDKKAAFPNNHRHHHRNVTPLQALPAAAVAATAPLGSLSVLAFIILVHEAGHFLAARSFGIKVKEFSVGIGPKVFGFVQGGEEETGQDAKGNNDGIEFNLRAIPFGGYVRFPENYNATLEYQLEQEAEDKRKQIEEKVKEIRNSGGGKTSAGLLSTIGSGFFNLAKSTTEEERRQALEMIASELKVQGRGQELGSNVSDMVPWWKTLFAASSNKNKQQEEKESRSIVIEQDGTVTVPPVEYYNDPDLLQNRSWVQRGIVLVGGVVFNIILAFLLYFGELTVGSGLPKPVFGQGAVVNSVARANSASVGLLDKGDVILALNGNPLTVATSSAYSSQETINDFISNIRATTPGESLHLSVLKYKSNAPMELDIKPLPMNEKDPSSPLSIGVMIAPNYLGNESVKAANPIDAAVKAANEVSELTSQTARSIFSLIGSLLISGGSMPAGQSLSGPIGVLKTGSDVVATNNISAVIGFAAAISINLAVVNSLPLPALDGGQLVFVVAEALTGKKVDQRKQEEITAAALFFLLLVSAGTTIGDVSSLLR